MQKADAERLLAIATAKLLELETLIESAAEKARTARGAAMALKTPVTSPAFPAYNAAELEAYGERRAELERTAIAAEVEGKQFQPRLEVWQKATKLLRRIVGLSGKIDSYPDEFAKAQEQVKTTQQKLAEKSLAKQSCEAKYRAAVEAANVSAAAIARAKLLVYDDILAHLQQREKSARETGSRMILEHEADVETLTGLQAQLAALNLLELTIEVARGVIRSAPMNRFMSP